MEPTSTLDVAPTRPAGWVGRPAIRPAAALAALLVCAAPWPAGAQDEPEGAATEPTTGREVPETPIDLEAVLHGEGRGMTADRAATLAVDTAPTVDEAEQELRQASEAENRALHGFVPRIELSASYFRLTPVRNGEIVPDQAVPVIDRVSDPAARGLWTALSQTPLPVVLDHYSVAGTLTFPVSDLLLEIMPRYEAAQGITEARRQRMMAARSNVALEARERFYAYARARAGLAVAQIALEEALLQEQQVRAHAAIGNVSRADELRMNAQAAGARVAVARAEGGVEAAATALRTVLHLEPGTEIGIGEDLLTGLPESLPPVEDLVRRGIHRRPEARALRAVVGAHDQAAQAADNGRLPSLYLVGNAEYASPSGRVFPQTPEFRFSGSVGVVLEWSVHEMLDGTSHADHNRAEALRAGADLRAIEDAIRVQVTEAHVAYRSARRALEAARLGLEAADEASRVRMVEFRTGNAMSSDLIDASIGRIRAQLDLVNAAIDARVALAHLRRASAGDPTRVGD